MLSKMLSEMLSVQFYYTNQKQCMQPNAAISAAVPTKGVISGSISDVGTGLVLHSLSVTHYRVNGTRLGWELAQPPAAAAGGWVDSSSIGA